MNSITLGTETLVAIELAWDGPLLVPELCSVMFGLEAGELGRGGGRGREPELVWDCTCIVVRGPPERITLDNSCFNECYSYCINIVANILLAMLLGKEPVLQGKTTNDDDKRVARRYESTAMRMCRDDTCWRDRMDAQSKTIHHFFQTMCNYIDKSVLDRTNAAHSMRCNESANHYNWIGNLPDIVKRLTCKQRSPSL